MGHSGIGKFTIWQVILRPDVQRTIQEEGMRFAEAPSGGSFGVISSETARDAALIDAGASYTLGSSAEMGLYYTGRFNSEYEAQAVTARFSYRF